MLHFEKRCNVFTYEGIISGCETLPPNIVSASVGYSNCVSYQHLDPDVQHVLQSIHIADLLVLFPFSETT